jgi:hypothetical protein
MTIFAIEIVFVKRYFAILNSSLAVIPSMKELNSILLSVKSSSFAVNAMVEVVAIVSHATSV